MSTMSQTMERTVSNRLEKTVRDEMRQRVIPCEICAFHASRLKAQQPNFHPHRRRIGIRLELSKQIAIEMYGNSSTQFGADSNSSLVWISLCRHRHPPPFFAGQSMVPPPTNFSAR